MIRVEKLTKEFGDVTVFHDIDLTINDGEVVGVIGPSGSGKSIFLRTLMMLEQPTSGKIYLDGEEVTNGEEDVNKIHEKIGMVFQDFNLFPHMSVLENVMSGQVHLQSIEPEVAYEEAMDLIKSVGLYDKAYEYPHKLSGGQKQRAAIARTVAMKPKMILFDEPTSAIDPPMRGEVEAVIRMMAAKGHTMIIVSHQMELVRKICNRVIFICNGGICEDGAPEQIFDHPIKDETRRFVRALRVLEFSVESKGFDFLGMQSTVGEFAYRNGVSRDMINRLLSITEELSQMVIIQPKEENKMKISIEYNDKEESIEGTVLFSGPKVDPDDPMYFFSWPIIVSRASEVTVESIDEGPYTNRVFLKLK